MQDDDGGPTSGKTYANKYSIEGMYKDELSMRHLVGPGVSYLSSTRLLSLL